MTERRALVLIDGKQAELPVGDTLAGSGGGVSDAFVTVELTPDRGDVPGPWAALQFTDGDGRVWRDAPENHISGSPGVTQYAIPDWSAGDNFYVDMALYGSNGTSEVGPMPPVVLLSPDTTGYEGKSGVIHFKSDVSWEYGSNGAVVILGPGWHTPSRPDLANNEGNLVDYLYSYGGDDYHGFLVSERVPNPEFPNERRGGDVYVRYFIDHGGRCVVSGYGLGLTIEPAPEPPPPPPPPPRNTLQIYMYSSPDENNLDGEDNPIWTVPADITTLLRQVRFKLANDTWLAPEITASTGQTSGGWAVDAYGYVGDPESPDYALPAPDANAFRVVDGNTATGFLSEEGDTPMPGSAGTMWIRFTPPEPEDPADPDLEIVAVEVLLGESIDYPFGIDINMYGDAGWDAINNGGWPSMYFWGWALIRGSHNPDPQTYTALDPILIENFEVQT